MSALAKQVAQTLRDVLGTPEEFIPLHAPLFEGDELANVSECITTGWISSVGKFVDQFEVDLAAFCGTERAVAVSNGTSALHICLLLAGVEPDDEVLIPSLTFVATGNAVKYCHATPHFVDVEESTLGIDPDKLADYLEQIAIRDDRGCVNRKTGRRISALVPMHAFGHPVRLEELVRVAEEWGIPLVEDAAESLGSYYKGVHTGGHGLMSAVSFNGNKIITTGGGGAILTNDNELADRAKHITTTAKKPHKWAFEHDEVGYNYRMPNLNAALGVAQLKELPGFLARKRKLAERYQVAFEGVDELRFLVEPENCRSNYWLNTLQIQAEGQLENVLETTNTAGLMTRPVWNPLHTLSIYPGAPAGNLDVTESLAKQLVNVPSSVELG